MPSGPCGRLIVYPGPVRRAQVRMGPGRSGGTGIRVESGSTVEACGADFGHSVINEGSPAPAAGWNLDRVLFSLLVVCLVIT